MSSYVGKDISNDNIIHISKDTREVVDLNNTPQDFTLFHSKLPYIQVANVFEFLPDATSITDLGADGLLQAVTYDIQGTIPLHAATKAYILIAEINELGTNQHWVTIGGVGNIQAAGGYWYSFAVGVIPDLAYSIVINHDTEGVPADRVNNLTDIQNRMPIRLKAFELTNSPTDLSSIQLSGDLMMSGADGVSIGGTNIFSSRFLMIKDTYNADSVVNPSEDIYKVVFGYKDVYGADPVVKYLHMTGGGLTGRYGLHLTNQEISYDNLGTPVYFIRQGYSWVQWFDVIYFDNVNPITDTRFTLGDNTGITRYQSTDLNVHTKIDISALNLTAGDAVFVGLRIDSINNHSFYFNGILGADTILSKYHQDTNYGESHTLCHSDDGFLRYSGLANIDLNYTFSRTENSGGIDATNVVGYIAKISVADNLQPSSLLTINLNSGCNTSAASTNLTTTQSLINYATYAWNTTSLYTYESTNVGDDDSFSYIEFTANTSITVSWSASGENDFDQLYVWKNGTLIVQDSNSTVPPATGSFTAVLGDSIVAVYTKDASVSSGDDKAIITVTLT